MKSIPIHNTRAAYGVVAQLLHWVTAALILSLIPLGFYMSDLPATTAPEVARKSWLYSLHKTLGVSVLFVSVIRIGWAIIQPRPRLLNADRPLESIAAHTVHWTLYGTIILMPLTGWLYHSATEGFAPIWWPLGQDLPLVPKSPWLAELARTAHFFTAILLTLSLCLHMGGAFKHAVLDRDATLRRMIPGLYQAPDTQEPVPAGKRLPVFFWGLVFVLLGATIVFAVNTSVFRPDSPQGPIALKPAGKSDVNWRVDPENSRLAIEVGVMGSPLAGHFEKWTARISFDPGDPSKAVIDVDVDIASLVLGSVKTQALSADFLNAADHPTGKFVSKSTIYLGGQRYEMTSELFLAGVRKPVTMQFDLSITGNKATVVGEALLDRFEFGIGIKGFPNSTVLDAKVPVRIKLEAMRAH